MLSCGGQMHGWQGRDSITPSMRSARRVYGRVYGCSTPSKSGYFTYATHVEAMIRVVSCRDRDFGLESPEVCNVEWATCAGDRPPDRIQAGRYSAVCKGVDHPSEVPPRAWERRTCSGHSIAQRTVLIHLHIMKGQEILVMSQATALTTDLRNT